MVFGVFFNVLEFHVHKYYNVYVQNFAILTIMTRYLLYP
jgi:hypothetical protein